MKKIEAIIKPFKLEDVRNSLASLEISGMTVSEVNGYGRQRGHSEYCKDAEYEADFLPKVKIEIILKDNEVDGAVEAIIQATRTGKIGDGKIFITNIEQAIRIRTGEKGEKAI